MDRQSVVPGSAIKPLVGVGRVIFVGASTGGTEAVKTFLLGIPEDCPPILIVQHMPETFTGSFAARLNGLCKPKVIEAQGGEVLAPGNVYVSPGHSHMRVRKMGGAYVTELLKTPPVNRHRPSVDVLFDSAAEVVGRNAIGVILTGMGKDGANGLLRMRQAGARTFGQDEASCVVYGMPREAALIGAVEETASLGSLAQKVLAALGRSV
ncbi:chemotaxis protein CheB [Propionivibrio sp.]|jgi:two-component system chemotaxis response regulator CheB|uniref:chemotaxis protein CheB n=1 Tax=Propionivibrio sp. TaxID=2212460 RepID=UPI00272DF17E|nr:chemotaxis protein CheB [Propionivibrio sp.]